MSAAAPFVERLFLLGMFDAVFRWLWKEMELLLRRMELLMSAVMKWRRISSALLLRDGGFVEINQTRTRLHLWIVM